MPESDEKIRELLSATRTIAVVGIKAGPDDDAYRIPAYLQRVGYRIQPVNPRIETVLGETAVASIGELDQPTDLIDLFRASDHIPRHAEEILGLPYRPLAVWMQLGIHCGEAAARLRARGITVVQDCCIMLEHRRLLGGA